MPTLSNETDGKPATAGAAMMTPKATGRASATSISKEDERRRKLQEWQESKASEKKVIARERKAVPDRKALFFERRERRLEEEKKKRMSRSGKENSSSSSSSTPTTTMTNPRSKVPSSAVASRLLSTPRPGQGPDAEGRLIGTSPVSAARGPPPRPRQAAATTSSAVRSACSSHADTVAAAVTTPSAGALGAGGEEAAGTPPPFSALRRPKASPYKEKGHPNAFKAAASGIDQPPVASSTTPTDRLSGQLARLGVAGAGSRRLGRVGGGGGGVAVGLTARRETFQGSRASSTMDPGETGVVRARPILRRVSSAILGSEVVRECGEVDRRRLALSVEARRKDHRIGPSTPAAVTAVVATTTTPQTPAAHPLRVSARSPNAPPTARLQLHPTNATQKQIVVLSNESSSSISSTTAAPAPAPTPVIVPKTATVLAEETNAASGADAVQGPEREALKAVPVLDVFQEPVPAKAVVPEGVSKEVAAELQTGTTKRVGSEESRRVEKVVRSKAVTLLAQDGATTVVAAAVAAATGTAVDENDAREARAPLPSSSPRTSAGEKPISYGTGEEGVGRGVGLIALKSKPNKKVMEEGQKRTICEGVAKSAAAMPTGVVPAPAKLEQAQGAPLPAPPALTAAPEATPSDTTTTEAAVEKEGGGESAAEDDAPAAIPSSEEVGAVLDEDGSVMDQKLSLFSRFSSVLSRTQQPSAATTTDRMGAGNESSSFSLSAEVQSVPDEASPSAFNPEHAGEKSLVVPPRGAKSSREVNGNPAISPSAAANKLREKNPARESPDESKAFVARTSKEAQEKASATSPAKARLSGLTSPENRSKPSAPPAGITNCPREEGRIEMARQATTQATAASPFRPRPALIPPGYRSRSSPPSTDMTDALREEGSVEPLSRRSKEATTRSPSGPLATGSTAPGYLSRLSPPSAGKSVSPHELHGKENEMKSSTGARSSGLTPPGYRSRLSPLSAGGMGSASRKTLLEDPTSGGLSSVWGSEVVKLTPDRRQVGAAVCARPAGGLEGTRPRHGVSPPRGACSPTQSPLEGPKHDRSRGTVPAGEDEHKKAEAQENYDGCSPIGRNGVAGGPQNGIGQQCSSPSIVKGRASTQPLLASPTQQQPLGVEKVQKDSEYSPMAHSSSWETAAEGSLEAVSPAKQRQRSPSSGAAAIDARKGGQKKRRKPTKQDTVCSPVAGGGAGPTATGAPECSTPRLVAAGVASAPPAASLAAGALEDTIAGVSSPDAADALTLSSGGRAASRASASPPSPPPPKDEVGKGQEDGSKREFRCGPNLAAGFVAGRRKRRAVSGVPVVTVAAAEAVAESPVSRNGGGGRRASSRPERAKQSREECKGGGGAGEEQEGGGENSSGESDSSWETCSSSEEEEGGEEGEREQEWGGLSYLDDINQHPYNGGVVIDPDLVRSGSSSNGGGSARSSLQRSSFGEARSGGRRSWGLKAPAVVTAEMGTQTGDGEGVRHALVQAGDGKLLSEAELQDECNQRELKERLEMMNHDRLSEVFHREILKQEEAQERKRLTEKHEAERLDLREENEALKLAHNNEKIRIRWEHMDELARVEAEAGDGAGLLEELQEERRLREQDREHHEAAQQKERQQRREWEARCDEHVRDKREQAKRHAEEVRRQVAAERKKLEEVFKKKLERHRDARKKAEEMVKEQLQALKEIDQENDELREENAQLRDKLGMEVEEEGGEEEEEGS